MAMNKTIWKYKIDTESRKCISMPISAEVIRVGIQNHTVCIWAVVLPEQKDVQNRLFYFSGTGHPVPLADKYIGSCTDGPFEWHVWEAL